MVNRSLFYLSLVVTLCSSSSVVKKYSSLQKQTLSWRAARNYCQEHHFDLLQKVPRGYIDFLQDASITKVWIGLLRDPQNEAAWRFITARKEELASGDYASQSEWEIDEQVRQCAYVVKGLWYSQPCTRTLTFYCSGNQPSLEKTLTWFEARTYCERFAGNLVTLTQANTDQFESAGWIGLYRVGKDQWRWADGNSSEYRNWKVGHPYVRDCVYLSSLSGKWLSTRCSRELSFYCYGNNLVLVNESKTWEEALEHCRSMIQHDLLSLEMDEFSATEKAMELAATDEVWTGLRFLAGAWFWVNNETLDHQANMPNCPPAGKHCGIISKANPSGFQARDCSERKNFICYKTDDDDDDDLFTI